MSLGALRNWRKMVARVIELDGIRGWAALSVMMAHLVFGVFVNAQPPLMGVISREFFELIFGGTLDVVVFFVVSGDALATAHGGARHWQGFVAQLFKRYCRLAMPILGSCTAVLLLTKAGLTFNHPAARILHTEAWLGTFLDPQFTIGDVLLYAAVMVFINDDPRLALNPFLGTMPIECLGSLIVFGYFLVNVRVRWKSIILLLLTALLAAYDSLLACFPFGIMCSYLRGVGAFELVRRSRAAQPVCAITAFVALAAGTYCNRVWPGWFLPSIASACMMILSIYGSRALSDFFSNGLSRWLGKISFPLYLMHFPVIASFTSGLVVVTWTVGWLGPITSWLIVLASAALSVLAAFFYLPVEVVTLRVSRMLSSSILNRVKRLSEIAPMPARASP